MIVFNFDIFHIAFICKKNNTLKYVKFLIEK